MAQYKAIKEQYSDAILMFRLGDFYEMFFEDALEASKILQITLTTRDKNSEVKTPMCGIPYHAVDNYLGKLTRAGKKVAICDQVTPPDGKGIVQREVVRVVTPGTTFDSGILDEKVNNFIAAIVSGKEGFGLAYCDVTTGEFKVTGVANLRELEGEIAKVGPSECIMARELLEEPKVKQLLMNFKNTFSFPYGFKAEGEEFLKEHFGVQSLNIFGLEGEKVLNQAAAMLMSYLRETQKTEMKNVQKIVRYETRETMALDRTLIRNLEIFQNNYDGKREGSLMWVMDRTLNAMGGRALRQAVLNPLMNREQIEKRLELVEKLVNNSSLLREVREEMGKIYDIERLLSRLALGIGNARDLNALRVSLEVLPKVKAVIASELGELSTEIENLEELCELVARAIREDAPMSVREGGMIASGYNAELDDLRDISTEGKTFIRELQEREIKRSGIASLKVKFNKVFGYYIEISNANRGSVPEDYIRKQTLVNAERYITPELKEYEEKVLTAEDRIKELEYNLFHEVRMAVVEKMLAIQKTARAIGKLDMLGSLAELAVSNNYCRPEISKADGAAGRAELVIKAGRHPVVEMLVGRENFVGNDCKMGIFSEAKSGDSSQTEAENRTIESYPRGQLFSLITGPNMGGKSTYLRQVALIVLMAQIGSYVPAEAARIGLVDRIFSRIGASDHMSRGESTFMVEMQEAAYILNNASERSLIILDEIGRGTSTYDGVSIAWAMMEYIHDKIGARTLFATHYHELIDLAERLPKAENLSVAVRENEKEGVVFLYKILKGATDKSYGIEVAKLAGLNAEIVGRARGVLGQLESKHIKRMKGNPDQLGLFVEEQKVERAEHGELRVHAGADQITAENPLLSELKNLDINSMTPLQAMQKLNEMKSSSLAQGESSLEKT